MKYHFLMSFVSEILDVCISAELSSIIFQNTPQQVSNDVYTAQKKMTPRGSMWITKKLIENIFLKKSHTYFFYQFST